ncbi:MAG: acyltransferase, partial [Lachnospiraceae bacterium]|nr:acyltransferase [Lachnospiraceae bacterium]
MREKHGNSYVGIDYFRVIAAFLVIAIHTSPLADVNELADFMLTRILARIAVPFFFMTSGFFLITRYHYNADRLKEFIRKTAVIYGISILLYLPVNLYNG